MTTNRSPWVICPTCSGDGKHSQHLGSYTQSEFDDAFDPEEQEEYFAGAYDTICQTCRGQGKLREDDLKSQLAFERRHYVSDCGLNADGEPMW